MMGDFHFLRPWWLVALVPAAMLWCLLRRRYDGMRSWQRVIAPHLLPYLVIDKEGGSHLWPIDAIALCWLLTILAIAGPTWRREPTPFADDVAAVAIVVQVTPSMTTSDIQPSRLTRGVEKIEDLLRLRKGAKTALVAYAGTAHVVMPTTTDDGIITTFAQALDPKIMPSEGDAVADAFDLADKTLADAGGGSILWIADSVAPEELQPLATWRARSATQVRLLPPLGDGPELDALTKVADSVEAQVTRLTADDGDVARISRAAKFATATSNEPGSQWHEAGYWLTPLIAFVTLTFFRRGWMAPSAAR
jgi:Ca-activated chloride channel family protein